MRRWGRLLLLVGAVGVGGVGCGALEGFDDGSGFGVGSPCGFDSDCVPADCCGQSTRAVNLDEAPSCSGVSCSPSSCYGQAAGGCGLVLCGQDGYCRMAIDTDCVPAC
jgi:hypothetical protein